MAINGLMQIYEQACNVLYTQYDTLRLLRNMINFIYALKILGSRNCVY